MKKILTFLTICFLLGACSSNQKSKTKPDDRSKTVTYKNEFFSVDYPTTWEFEEEINTMNDTIPGLFKGVRTTFYNPFAPSLTVCVQKSSMFDCFDSPTKWRDLSIELKQFTDGYIDVVDKFMVDSMEYDGYPASMAGFLLTEGNDTLIHKQIVLMDGPQLYYLHNTFDWNDDGSLEAFGDSILRTFKIIGSDRK